MGSVEFLLNSWRREANVESIKRLMHARLYLHAVITKSDVYSIEYILDNRPGPCFIPIRTINTHQLCLSRLVGSGL